jgi:hypothetical protein
LLGSADYTSTSGTSVVLAQGASVDDLIVIVVYDVFSVADTVSKTNGGTFDGAVSFAGDITDSGDLTVDVAGDITLDADGSQVIFADGGTNMGEITNDGSSNFVIKSLVQDKDIIFKGNDGGSTITPMTIDMSEGGRVGIGETSPDVPLHITYTKDVAFSIDNFTQEANVGLKIENTSSTANAMSIMQFRTGSGADLFFGIEQKTGNDGEFVFGNQNSPDKEFMRLDVNGDLFLGTSTANAVGKIDVEFNGTSRNGIVLKTTRSATGTNFMEFLNSSGGNAGEINHNGSTSVNYSTSSDYRLKENVSYNFDATTRLKQLKPARFNFIADGTDRIVDGFLAHEVQLVVPEAITGTHNGVEVWKDGEELPDGISVGDNKLDNDGNTIPKYQSIDQSKLVPLLVKTIQELEARITALENAE